MLDLKKKERDYILRSYDIQLGIYQQKLEKNMWDCVLRLFDREGEKLKLDKGEFIDFRIFF